MFQLADQEHLIQSATEEPMDPAGAALNSKATLIGQLAEWGMQMVQSQFPCLHDSIAHKEQGERLIVLHLMVLLHNCNTQTMKINQLLNTHVSEKEGFQTDQGHTFLSQTANKHLG